MSNLLCTLFLFSAVILACSTSTTVAAPLEQSCSTHQFSNHKTFAACNDLPVLNSTLHWNYYPSTGTVEVAFRQKSLVSDSRWVAWGINPTSPGMVGSQALVASHRSDGNINISTSYIRSYRTHLEQGTLTFPVYNLSAAYENSKNEITIYASLGLPMNVTTVHHVWQEGPLDPNGNPGMHSMSARNLQSFGTLDFLSGKVEATGTHHTIMSPMKIAHGIVNTVSWGILMPMGAIIARNLKGLDPTTWFYMHVYCQILGFSGGALVGSVTGFLLGYESPGVEYKGHKCIGITLLCLVVSQVLVGCLLRPKPDHKYRIFWNMFHYTCGYSTIVMGIVNIFKGFDILKPPKIWKQTYIGILASLILVGVVGEAVRFWKNKTTTREEATTNSQQDLV